jgi:glycosyltransferase involved in cell wall biosynthesis
MPLWEQTRDKMPGYFGPGSLARLGLGYTVRAIALAARVMVRRRVDLFVAGFNGQLDAILLRLVRWRAPIVFAPLVSITETLVEDREIHAAGSNVGRLVNTVDRWSLRLPSRVLIDTEAHRRYLVEELGAQPARIACWHLGADWEVFRPYAPRPRGGPLRVLFYGQFLPLHGVDVILAAMAELASDPAYEFTVVGTGPERRRALEAVPRRALDRVRLAEWVSYEQLGELVASADVCLGTFGSSRKARMVIPNKVYQAAAVGRAVLTADTPALREVFTPGSHLAVCAPGDVEALVDGIRRLRADDEREALALAARQLMAFRFSRQAQATALEHALAGLGARAA